MFEHTSNLTSVVEVNSGVTFLEAEFFGPSSCYDIKYDTESSDTKLAVGISTGDMSGDPTPTGYVPPSIMNIVEYTISSLKNV
jgi:hypothetical protein